MKKWMLFMLVAGLAFGACGCTAEKPEAFEVVQSFEYHFYPEEYDEKYTEYQKIWKLQPDTDYQIEIQSGCQSGSLQIDVTDANTFQKQYTVSADAPCNKVIDLAGNTSEAVTVEIKIEADTKGQVTAKLAAQ